MTALLQIPCHYSRCLYLIYSEGLLTILLLCKIQCGAQAWVPTTRQSGHNLSVANSIEPEVE